MKTLLVLAFLVVAGMIGWFNSDQVMVAYKSVMHWATGDSSAGKKDGEPSHSWSMFGAAKSQTASAQVVVLQEPYYFVREKVSFEEDATLRILNPGTKVRKLGGGTDRVLVEVSGHKGVIDASKLTQTSADISPGPAVGAPATVAFAAESRRPFELQVESLERQIAQTKDELIKEQKRQDMWKLTHHNDPVNDQGLFLKNEILRLERDRNAIQVRLAGLPMPPPEQ